MARRPLARDQRAPGRRPGSTRRPRRPRCSGAPGPTQRTVRATLATLGDHELAAPVGDRRRRGRGRRTSTGSSAARCSAARWSSPGPATQAPALAARLRELGADGRRGAGHRDRRAGRRRRRAARRGRAGSARTTGSCSRRSNGVDRLLRRDPRHPGARRGAGRRHRPRHRRRARRATGWWPTSCPSEFVAESLLDALPDRPTDRPGRVLLARAAVARDVLPDGLRARGWEVDVVEAYRTVPGAADRGTLDAAATADAITFTSSSTVTHYLDLAGPERVPPVVACIGPSPPRPPDADGLAVDRRGRASTPSTAWSTRSSPRLRRERVSAAADAVVFDFDGLIVDTEWSIYEMAAATFAEFDIDLAVPVWATIVGPGRRERLVGPALRDERLGGRPGRVVAALPGDRPQLPRPPAGAARRGRAARRPRPPASVPRGIASSSAREWIEGHLGGSGCSTASPPSPASTAPAWASRRPTCYLLACADLGADPARSVAVEDSGHGIAAAKAAGLACVAVPSRITRHTDLSAADLTVASLADLGPADLGRAGRRRRAGGNTGRCNPKTSAASSPPRIRRSAPTAARSPTS